MFLLRVLLLLATPTLVLAASPIEPVDKLHQTLTQNMAQSAKLKCEGRLERLGPVVDSSFDLPFIAQRALRRHWKTLDDAQRQRFTSTLRSSVITTYAVEFDTPNSVRFSPSKADDANASETTVHSTLSPAKGSPVTLDYLVKNGRIVNVLAEGVSDLALRASQYDAVMKNGGFEPLMSKLTAQNTELRSRCK